MTRDHLLVIESDSGPNYPGDLRGARIICCAPMYSPCRAVYDGCFAPDWCHVKEWYSNQEQQHLGQIVVPVALEWNDEFMTFRIGEEKE